MKSRVILAMGNLERNLFAVQKYKNVERAHKTHACVHENVYMYTHKHTQNRSSIQRSGKHLNCTLEKKILSVFSAFFSVSNKISSHKYGHSTFQFEVNQGERTQSTERKMVDIMNNDLRMLLRSCE